MLKLVNYKIEDKEIKVKNYQEDNRDVILYDKNAIAIIDSNLSLNQELTMLKIDDEPFPIIVSKEFANKLSEKNTKTKRPKAKIDIAKAEVEKGE